MRFIFLLIFLFLIFGSFDTKSDYVVSDDSYNLHSLSFSNLSTNNFFNYFSNIDVVRIYPYINPIYDDMIGNIYYDFSYDDIVYNFNLFKEKYLSLIKKNSYLDYNYLFVNGFNIDRVDVYLSDKQLYDLSNSDLIFNIIK